MDISVSGAIFEGSFISHYLYRVNMERKVRLQHMNESCEGSDNLDETFGRGRLGGGGQSILLGIFNVIR